MEKPPIEEWKEDAKYWRDPVFDSPSLRQASGYLLTLCDYALELEAQLKAEQESVNGLSLHCQDLEARIKREEDEVEFTDCVFDGGPPAQYSSWSAWAGAHPKTGVFISALKDPGKEGVK